MVSCCFLVPVTETPLFLGLQSSFSSLECLLLFFPSEMVFHPILLKLRGIRLHMSFSTSKPSPLLPLLAMKAGLSRIRHGFVPILGFFQSCASRLFYFAVAHALGIIRFCFQIFSPPLFFFFELSNSPFFLDFFSSFQRWPFLLFFV